MSMRIAIVGAGMAGASCAWHLRQAGAQVDVFDKSPDVGGRMAARAVYAQARGNPLACNVDHGAQYFTARDEGFARFVRGQLGAGGSIAAWQPRMAAAPSHPLSRSLASEPWYVGAPSMPAAIRHLLEGCGLFTEAHILKLEQDIDGWTLEAAEGPHEHSHYSGYDAVVVAIPATLARRLVRPHSAELAQICQQAVMTPCWSVQVVAEATPEAADIYLELAPGLAWVARDSSKPGRQLEPGLDTWVLHADAAWSAEHLEADVGAVAAALEGAFVAGMRQQGHVLRLLSGTAHRWRHARAGRWDAPGVGLDEGLALCGDYLRSGRVESAFVSGREAAQGVLATIQR